MAEWWKRLWSQVTGATSVGILTHEEPDGDGLAVALAFKAVLHYHHVEADIVLEKEAPGLYFYLQAKENTVLLTPELRYDLLLILDCHEEVRLGACRSLIPRAKQIFVVDHHERKNKIPGSIAMIRSQEVSVGTLLHPYLSAKLKGATADLKRYYAECMYTSILNDTDNFMNANTNGKVYRMSEQLVRYGLIPHVIANEFLLGKPPLEMRFIGEVLSTIELHHGNRILFMDSTLQMLETNGLTQDATSKLTRWVKGLQGVDIVVYFRELEPGEYRLSIRSTGASVNQLAAQYGGGGHKLAAGCSIRGTLTHIKKQILEDLDGLLNAS